MLQKGIKYVKLYGYKKPSLKAETTENVRYHMIPRKHFVFWDFPGIRWQNSFVCREANNTHHDFAKRKFFFNPL